MKNCSASFLNRLSALIFTMLLVVNVGVVIAQTHTIRIYDEDQGIGIYKFEVRNTTGTAWDSVFATDTRIVYESGWWSSSQMPDADCPGLIIFSNENQGSCSFSYTGTGIRVYYALTDAPAKMRIVYDEKDSSTYTNFIDQSCTPTMIGEKLYVPTGPTGSLLINDNNGFTNNLKPSFTITTPADSARYTLDTISLPLWKVRVAQDSLAAGFSSQGKQKIYYQFKTGALSSAWLFDTTFYDNVLPTSTVTTAGVYGGANKTWTTATSLAGTVPDGNGTTAISAIDSVKITIQRSPDNFYYQGTANSWLAAPKLLKAPRTNATWAYSFAATNMIEGITYSITSKAYDKALNIQTPVGNGSYLYSTSALSSITAFTVPTFTKTATITPAFTAANNPTEMKISLLTDTGSTPWSTTIGSKAFALTTEGSVTFAAKVKNILGESVWAFATTMYDKTPPTSQITTPSIASGITSAWPGSVGGTATDGGSGIDSVQVQIQNPAGAYWNGSTWGGSASSWFKAGTGVTFTYPLASTNFAADGAYALRSRAFDKATNMEAPAFEKTFAVANPPSAKLSKKADTVLVPNAWSITASVTGTVSSYAWYRVGTATPIPNNSSAILTLPSTSSADKVAQFYCIVTGAASANSDTVTLRVIEKVKANFSVLPQVGQAPLATSLNDSSAGSILRWKIRYSTLATDTVSYTTRPLSVAKTYTDQDTGDHKITLYVYGSTFAGLLTNIDSLSIIVSVLSKNANPLQITAKAISGVALEVTLTGKIRATQNITGTYADSVYLYFGEHGLPIVPASDLKSKAYATLNLGVKIGDTVTVNKKDTIVVPLGTSAAKQYYSMWVVPYWKPINQIATYSSANAVAIRMASVNTFGASAKYLGNSSGNLAAIVIDTPNVKNVSVTITNAAKIDTAAKEIAIRFVANNTDLIPVEIVPRATFVAGIQGGTFVRTITNTRFFADTQTVRVAIVQNFQNGLPGTIGIASDTVWTSFIIGLPLIKNTSQLRVDSTQTYSAWAKWSAIQNVDSIRILTSNTDLGLGQPLIGGGVMVTYPASLSDNNIWVKGLSDSTTYYFAMQVMRNLLWSDITASTKATAKTKAFNAKDTVPNETKIESLKYDSTAMSLVVGWSRLPNDKVAAVGITYGTDSNSVFRINRPDINGFGYVVTTAPPPASGTEIISIAANLVFDTTYYVATWVRSAEGGWAVPILAQSRAVVKTSKFSRQPITIFPAGKDTLRAFNNNVIIAKATASSVQTPDTVVLRTIVSPSPELIPISIGVSLSLSVYPPVNLGIAFSLPAGESPLDIGLFRDSAGIMLALYGFTVDRVNNIVWINSSLLDPNKKGLPIVVMVDKARPVVTFKSPSDTADLAMVGMAESDTFSIRDQVGNARWILQYAKDASAFDSTSLFKGNVRSDIANETYTTIPGDKITDENGLRARLIVSDGVHTDTISISRRVSSSTLGVISTDALRWTPIYITRELQTAKLSEILAKYDPFRKGDAFSYDPLLFRLYKWNPVQQKAPDANWKEYSAHNDSLFTCKPGDVFWLKTKENATFALGTSTSISQKSDFIIPVPPNAWLDIAIPFRYNIVVGDILDATGTNGKALDLYSWRKNDAGRYFSQLIYSNNQPLLDKETIRIPSLDTMMYTIFNRDATNAVELHIPPLPEFMTAHVSMNKKVTDGTWGVRLSGNTKSGFPLGCSFIGYDPESKSEQQFFEGSPTLYQTRAGIVDGRTNKVMGRTVIHATQEGGVQQKIAFVNDGDNAEIFEYAMTGMLLPQGYQVRAQDGGSGVFVAGNGTITQTVPAHCTQYVTIAVGNAAYFEKSRLAKQNVRFSVSSLYPNPFRSVLTVRYTVPLVGVSSVRFTIINCLGRTISSQTVRNLMLGERNIFNYSSAKSMSAGMYFLRIEALDDQNKVTAVATHHLTCAK